MPASNTIQQLISRRLSSNRLHFQSVGGGSINDCYCISFDDENLFCKVNSANKFPHLFQKEKAGLALIAKQSLIKTPTVIDCFEGNDTQILLLEWIQSGNRTETFWKAFGEQLAALHLITAESFGFTEDNYMGSVPQSNHQHKTWTAFFAEERLQPMIERCYQKRQLNKTHLFQFENLTKHLPILFEGEKPSLLHGDLWSGNFMCNQNNEPVLIDPAVYYGHRSMDLAMTTLFGGFRQPFYEAYNYQFPLPKNHEAQWAVCNLYPLLIHLYLFGASYLPQIEKTLQRLA